MKIAASILAAVLAVAAPLASAKPPAGATGLCKDGTYTRTASRAAACEGHRGLKTWYGKKKASTAASRTEADASSLRPDKPADLQGDRLNNTQPSASGKR